MDMLTCSTQKVRENKMDIFAMSSWSLVILDPMQTTEAASPIEAKPLGVL